jgi:hypothetical protein
VLFVANGYYQQETDIYNHLQDLGMFDVEIKKDYQIYGSTDLTVYDLIIITGFAPNIGYSGTNNIKNSGIPLMIIEYWDFWYSYRMGLLNWDSGDYYGTDTVELINDQHPITNGLDQEVEVYDESWAVLYGASLNSLSSDTEPLIYSWQSANEAAVIVDDARKMVATGIYDTTHYTDDAWEIFDRILDYFVSAAVTVLEDGFENGNLDDWTAEGDASITSDSVYSGQYSVELNAQSGNASIEGLLDYGVYDTMTLDYAVSQIGTNGELVVEAWVPGRSSPMPVDRVRGTDGWKTRSIILPPNLNYGESIHIRFIYIPDTIPIGGDDLIYIDQINVGAIKRARPLPWASAGISYSFNTENNERAWATFDASIVGGEEIEFYIALPYPVKINSATPPLYVTNIENFQQLIDGGFISIIASLDHVGGGLGTNEVAITDYEILAEIRVESHNQWVLRIKAAVPQAADSDFFFEKPADETDKVANIYIRGHEEKPMINVFLHDRIPWVHTYDVTPPQIHTVTRAGDSSDDIRWYEELEVEGEHLCSYLLNAPNEYKVTLCAGTEGNYEAMERNSCDGDSLLHNIEAAAFTTSQGNPIPTDVDVRAAYSTASCTSDDYVFPQSNNLVLVPPEITGADGDIDPVSVSVNITQSSELQTIVLNGSDLEYYIQNGFLQGHLGSPAVTYPDVIKLSENEAVIEIRGGMVIGTYTLYPSLNSEITSYSVQSPTITINISRPKATLTITDESQWRETEDEWEYVIDVDVDVDVDGEVDIDQLLASLTIIVGSTNVPPDYIQKAGNNFEFKIPYTFTSLGVTSIEISSSSVDLDGDVSVEDFRVLGFVDTASFATVVGKSPSSSGFDCGPETLIIEWAGTYINVSYRGSQLFIIEPQGVGCDTILVDSSCRNILACDGEDWWMYHRYDDIPGNDDDFELVYNGGRSSTDTAFDGTNFYLKTSGDGLVAFYGLPSPEATEHYIAGFTFDPMPNSGKRQYSDGMTYLQKASGEVLQDQMTIKSGSYTVYDSDLREDF